MDLRQYLSADLAGLLERFDTAIAAFVPSERWGERAGGEGGAIAWLLFHSAYHQDLAIGPVLAGTAPLLPEHRAALGLPGHDPVVGLGEEDVRSVAGVLDPTALRTYAGAVADRAATWLDTTEPAGLGPQLDTVPDAVAALRAHGLDLERDVPWLARLWTGRPAHWFVRWELIGHLQGHLGEMISVRNRLGLSPF